MKKLFTGCIILLFASCADFLEEYSQDLAKVETDTDYDELLLGDAYLPIGGVFSDGGWIEEDGNKYFQAAHYMSDELEVFSWDGKGDNYLGIQDEMFGWHTWQRDVGMNTETNTRVAEDRDWNQAYHYINTCNAILAGIDGVEAGNTVGEQEKTRIKGEAAFLRGLYYFTLVNLYGEPYSPENRDKKCIPLKLNENVEETTGSVATVDEVYRQVLADLDLADTCLSQTSVKNHPYRADITAVYLLKSRVYLYMQDWTNALLYAREVIARQPTLLDLRTFDGLTDVLTKSSPETIFSMGGHYLSSSICNQYGDPDGWGIFLILPAYLISDDLVNAFDEGENDLRTRYYIQQKDSIGGGGIYEGYAPEWIFMKVKGWEFGYKEVSDNFLFRVSEAYLNGAEAAAYLGDEATARDLLKTLRDHRLTTSAPVTASGEALVTLVRNERQRELCLEGHRWFDLRRYTVCDKYPYSREITHYYTYFDGLEPAYSKSYKLLENDPSYTLALPREVLEFENQLGENFRPVRQSADYVPDIPEPTRSEAYQLGHADGLAAGILDAQNGTDTEYANGNKNPWSWDDWDNYMDYEDGYDAGYEQGYNQ